MCVFLHLLFCYLLCVCVCVCVCVKNSAHIFLSQASTFSSLPQHELLNKRERNNKHHRNMYWFTFLIFFLIHQCSDPPHHTTWPLEQKSTKVLVFIVQGLQLCLKVKCAEMVYWTDQNPRVMLQACTSLKICSGNRNPWQSQWMLGYLWRLDIWNTHMHTHARPHTHTHTHTHIHTHTHTESHTQFHKHT